MGAGFAGVSANRQCGEDESVRNQPRPFATSIATPAAVLAAVLPAILPAILIVAAASPTAGAAEKRHGVSIFGDLKYPPDFKHFDYVNPNAPKSGRMSTTPIRGSTKFDSFNPFILKGDSAAGLLEHLYDSLVVGSGDEKDAAYGLVAHSIEVADDRMSTTFYMRPEARFADGSPVTADDPVFTFDTLKTKGHPSYRFVLRDVVKAEAIDKHTVRYTFKGDQTRDLPLLVGGLPILSKAYYDTRDFTKTTLDEPPLGSGPYELVGHKPNAYVDYRRRDDYWAKDLPVNVGQNNFAEIRYNYYQDRGASLIGFAGGEYDLREEFVSKSWATGYNFPAVKDGRVKLLTLPDDTPSGTQGWFINTRRKKFADPRVRQALGYAFDFEWTNKNLFFSLYKRTDSFFVNSEMAASGKPSPEELALLQPFKKDLPESVFAEAYKPPVSDGSGRDRKLLREANRLLIAAGYKIQNRKRMTADGKPFTVEFIREDASFDRILLPFVKNLRALGIDANIRAIDSAQMERRRKTFDYDIMPIRFPGSMTPGVELRNLYHSSSADVDGSFNLSGIKSPVVDALIKKIIIAKSRADLTTAARALDRVLRAGHYWVPNWYKGAHNIAYWDKFARPKVKAKYARAILSTWWYDAAKAAKLKQP